MQKKDCSSHNGGKICGAQVEAKLQLFSEMYVQKPCATNVDRIWNKGSAPTQSGVHHAARERHQEHRALFFV
jgi:hypothetical protein